MNIRMTIQNGNTSTPWQFTGHALIVGRDTSCDLPLTNSPIVSSRHVRMEYIGRQWLAADAGSRNGTYLNGRLIQGSQPIRPGDVLRLGPSGPQLHILDARQPFALQGPAGRIEGRTPQPVPCDVAPTPAADSPSPTRLMLRQVLSQQKRNRLLRVAACLLVVASAAAFMMFGYSTSNSGKSKTTPIVELQDEDNETPKQTDTNKTPKADPPSPEPTPTDKPSKKTTIFNKAVRHAVFILTPRRTTGSGSIFNGDRRLILTNYHVVRDDPEVKIFFPKYKPNGKLIRDRNEYLRNHWYTIGRVLITEKSKDIAVVQVDSIPASSRVISFAAKSAKVGENIHLVGGNAQGSGGAMWGYVNGRVRSITYEERFPVGNHNGTLSHIVRGHIVRSTMRSHPGTSGGAVINAAGEFVALNFAGRTDGDRHHLDVRDVRQYLRQNGFMD